MKKRISKLLREYAGSQEHYQQMKVWWNGLSAPERAQAAEEIRAALRKQEAQEKANK